MWFNLDGSFSYATLHAMSKLMWIDDVKHGTPRKGHQCFHIVLKYQPPIVTIHLPVFYIGEIHKKFRQGQSEDGSQAGYVKTVWAPRLKQNGLIIHVTKKVTWKRNNCVSLLDHKIWQVNPQPLKEQQRVSNTIIAGSDHFSSCSHCTLYLYG